jgi:Phosphoadenosine phosphosulfate reductase family
MSKTEEAEELIREWVKEAAKPAALISFGKDSMVLAHLIRAALQKTERTFPCTCAFPLPVIYHRDPWFPQKHEFADDIIRSWDMEVHDFPPGAAGVKVKDDMLELVARYNFGDNAIDIPKNISKPEEHPRRKYICGLNDWLLRPKTLLVPYPWDLVFHGHKSCDVDPFEGEVPLRYTATEAGGVMVVFPLREWTDEEVWNYIEQHHVPLEWSRYSNWAEKEDKWYNNDYIPACTNCIDPRVTTETVYCPKLKAQVPNQGAKVLQLNAQPHYLDK